MTKYQELAEQLRSRIGTEFTIGDRLPGISALQAEYDIRGLNTVREALRVLADEGLIRTEHGRGSFVTTVPEPRSSADDNRPDVVTIHGISDRNRRVLATRAAARSESLNTYLLGLITRHATAPTAAEVLERAAGHDEHAETSSLEALEATRGERNQYHQASSEGSS